MIALRIVAAAVIWIAACALFASDEFWPRCLFGGALVIVGAIGGVVIETNRSPK